ncbi:hypothetical protein ACFQ1L_36840 [Phytohabitans flavus]|uniref:hypothetical protein n=1 Tax=Phytohabitans flavus TaxID=1076124 RepID=UPI001564212F|nr:hypothetical protein [Phytohabitans flavus]
MHDRDTMLSGVFDALAKCGDGADQLLGKGSGTVNSQIGVGDLFEFRAAAIR